METLLDSMGITILVRPQRRYIEVRDELANMHPLGRWLSFRKRHELHSTLLAIEQAKVMSQTIEALT